MSVSAFSEGLGRPLRKGDPKGARPAGGEPLGEKPPCPPPGSRPAGPQGRGRWDAGGGGVRGGAGAPPAAGPAGRGAEAPRAKPAGEPAPGRAAPERVLRAIPALTPIAFVCRGRASSLSPSGASGWAGTLPPTTHTHPHTPLSAGHPPGPPQQDSQASPSIASSPEAACVRMGGGGHTPPELAALPLGPGPLSV